MDELNTATLRAATEAKICLVIDRANQRKEKIKTVINIIIKRQLIENADKEREREGELLNC